MRRWKIHGDNIVSLLHGIYLNLSSSRAEFKVQQNSSCACAARLFGMRDREYDMQDNISCYLQLCTVSYPNQLAR